MFQFAIFGFPVRIHWLFWVTCVVLGGGFRAQGSGEWIQIAVFTAVVFVSIMVHELGHAVVGRKYGGKPSILLHGLGGLTMFPRMKLNRAQSILLSLAGPAAGLMLWFAVTLIARLINTDEALANYTIRTLIFLNLFWSIFNLLPILPMDGGQILRSALGPKNARLSSIIGTVTAGILCMLALLAGLWIVGLFLAFMAYNNFQSSRQPASPLQGGVHHG